MSVIAIIAGGGRGLRMASSVNKQFLKIADKPIIAHTIEKFEHCPLIDEIIIVVPEDWIDFVSNKIVSTYQFSKVAQVVKGGTTRQDSVFAALEALDEAAETVVIHDAVRPLIQPALLEKVIIRGQESGAAILAVQVKDTVKRVAHHIVGETLERDSLYLVQTPQVFKKELILRAYHQARKGNVVATDDAALVERLGYAVSVVEGNYSNLKITTPGDLELAEFMLSREQASR